MPRAASIGSHPASAGCGRPWRDGRFLGHSPITQISSIARCSRPGASVQRGGIPALEDVGVAAAVREADDDVAIQRENVPVS